MIRRVVGAGMALALAALGLLLFGPAAFLSSAPEKALEWSTHDRALIHEAARKRLAEKSYTATAQLGRQAIVAMPFDSFGLLAASLGGNEDTSIAALNVAAALGWRDPTTNAALIEAAVATGDPAIAAQRLDALGRIRPNAASGTALDRVLRMRGGVDALSDRLARHASVEWWETALRERPAGPDSERARLALVARIDPGDGDIRRRLVESAGIGFGDPALEWQAWRAAYGADADFGGFVYDPDFSSFEPSRKALGGEWRMAQGSRGLAERVAGGAELAVPPGGRVALLEQVVAPVPGPVRLKAAGTAEGLGWSLTCGPTPLLLDGETMTRGVAGSWSVHIPPDCDFLLLQLSTRAPNSLRIEARIERVTLEPLP